MHIKPPVDPPNDLMELLNRCYIEKPDKKDLQTLKRYLESNPHLFGTVFDLAYTTQRFLIDATMESHLGRMGIYANVDHMRKEMEYDNSPILERLLIENVINCWLRLQGIEFLLSGNTCGDRLNIRSVEFLEKRLSASQRRYLRACETLARVRKLTRNTPLLQVNIATERGQQVNIAGDLVKNKLEKQVRD